MDIQFPCRYCGTNNHFKLDNDIRVPARAFEKVNCKKCNSRFALDINIRVAGKSSMIKKEERAAKAKAERAGQALYEQDSNSVIKTWFELQPWERSNWISRAARR